MMKLAIVYISFLYLVIAITNPMQDFIKEPLNENDMNQKEAIEMAKNTIHIKGVQLKVLTIYLLKHQFEYSYIITIARIINSGFTVHSITINCSKDSYWSATVYNSMEENMLSVSFHLPLYILLQSIVEKYYSRRSQQLKHLTFIHQCSHLYFTKGVLKEYRNQIEIVAIEKYKGEFNIETVFTLN